MNVVVFDENLASVLAAGEKVSGLGAVFHHANDSDALQQVLSKLCERYGSRCCLVIHDSFDEIVERVNGLSSPSVSESASGDSGERQMLSRQFQRLSPRESEVLCYVLDGLTSQEIADRLKISLRTVKMHRGNIMAKVRVRNVAELVSLYHTTAAKAA
jgi:DNA-binding CsgD family transcriptional regulator